MARFARSTLLAGLVAGLALTGCAATSRVDDQITTAALAKNKTSVAIMRAGFVDELCDAGIIGVGRKVDGGYQLVQRVMMISSFTEHGTVPQVELEAGEYHIISFSCQRGRSREFVQLMDPRRPGLFLKSYASFTLGPGEIINLGELRIVRSRLVREFVVFEAADLPPQSHAKLKQERPNIHAQMKTRLMTVPKRELTADQKKLICDAIERRVVMPERGDPNWGRDTLGIDTAECKRFARGRPPDSTGPERAAISRRGAP